MSQHKHLAKSGDDEPTTFCSVLNVVVDHVMKSPTPLEPEEFQQQQAKRKNQRLSLQVPVLRVFGSVLRPESVNSSGATPTQAACLYIHGAFPYILARPVLAGPDGSLIQASPSSQHVNWDSVESVRRVVPHITTVLEESLQSMELGDWNNNNSNSNGNKSTTDFKSQQKQQSQSRIIRRVTVVQGRGFYTYCPGPPAPFLRIEYYNPKLRWKVKLQLERGLELPSLYHPDPPQYSRNHAALEDLLKFHCYEAHIPYTMQFFKDYNLAGLSYIHLSNGRLRGRLPSGSTDVDDRSKFTRSNTPSCYTWQDYQLPSFSPNNDPPHILQSSPLSPAMTGIKPSQVDTHQSTTSWKAPAKETSCSIELDCTVQDIMNIKAILTTMPSDQDERDAIQWRAVPSLQEIWKQERHRMQKLLPPSCDFLSHFSQAKFTLNVKQGASRPGAKLAARGMKSLVNVTPGLQDELHRALKQIVDRHEGAVAHVDESIRQRRAKKGLAAGQGDFVCSHEHASQSDCVSHDKPLPQKSEGETELTLTPTLDEAMKALETLADHFQDEDGQDHSQNLSSATVSSASSSLCSNRELPLHDRHDILANTPYSQSSTGGAVSLCYNSSQQVQEGTTSGTMDLVEYSQRMERGDWIVPDMGDLEDSIDPDTLLPYDELHFGSNRCLILFVVETDPPGTRRVCGGMAHGCSRLGHSSISQVANFDNSESNGDYNAMVLERAKPGYYKTITTGAFVDGIIFSGSQSCRMLGEDDDGYDEGDKDSLENVLSVLATQMSCRETADTMPKDAKTSSHNQFSAPYNLKNLTQSFGKGYQADLASFEDEDGSRNENESLSCENESAASSEPPNPGKSCNAAQTTSLQPVSTQWDGICLGSVMPVSSPPSRAALETGSQLHKLEDCESIPTWMTHAARYTELRKKYVEDRPDTATWFPKIGSSGIYVEPVRRPPTKGQVEEWQGKQLKRLSSTKSESMVKRAKAAKPKKVAHKNSDNGLEIDGNTRMLVPSESKKLVPVVATERLGVENVEEVRWESSQVWQLSASQLTQNDESGETKECTMHPSSPFQESPPSLTKSSGQSVSSNQTWQKGESPGEKQRSQSKSSETGSRTHMESQTSDQALEGIGNQGGRLLIEGGGGLKTKTRPSQANNFEVKSMQDGTALGVFLPSPVSFMSIEIHVQCRSGSSRLDARKIAMAPDSNKDKVVAVVFLYGRDPGGGESLQFQERGCIFVSPDAENSTREKQVAKLKSSIPRSTFGISAPLTVECVKDEKSLLLRLSALVRMKDPDMLLSWDTQGAGLGYLIERGASLRETNKNGEKVSVNDCSGASDGVDMVRLLGRTPYDRATSNFLMMESTLGTEALAHGDLADQQSKAVGETMWKGSGLGGEWDDRVGAGAAAASIVSDNRYLLLTTFRRPKLHFLLDCE